MNPYHIIEIGFVFVIGGGLSFTIGFFSILTNEDRDANVLMSLLLLVIGLSCIGIFIWSVFARTPPDDNIYPFKIEFEQDKYYVDDYKIMDGGIYCDDYWFQGKHHNSELVILEDDVTIHKR